ncbi:EspA/EspE family type VII secretion system effector [Mycobacterium aquaticum]|uniref:TPR repeat region-containing protein n=1 Tax=Mycobacterium aquaticum TaxID=1927124 RepID=UPI001B808833|nr:EspA/EspE family type VII secretion system effector [Mycobacterium aquaticum]
MGLLDAFNQTWSQARETFGQGTPEDGSKFDGSSRLLQMKSSVEAAAPDSRWQGTASDAYAAANKEHAQVYGKLADLDKRMAAEVTNAATVVTTGRQNLDNVKSWVTRMAASIPDTDADERDRKLLPIVNKGVSQLSDIIQKSTNDMTDIRGRVQGIKGEYDALTNQKFAPGEKGPGEKKDEKGNKKGDVLTLTDKEKEKEEEDKKKSEVDKRKAGVQNAADAGRRDGESLADGKLSPEESKRLQDATNLSGQERVDLNNGNLQISPERMAYLNGLSHSLDGKSPAEIKSILGKLPPSEAAAVSNALHLVGSDKVHTDPISPSLKPGDPGFVPTVGGKENLPKSIQDIFDAPLRNNPFGETVTMPDGSKIQLPPDHNKPYKFLDEYRDIAAISNYADPSVQRGSALNDGMLAESRELLEDFQSDRWPNYDDRWGHENLDPTLQQLLAASSNDPTAVHDAIVGADGKSPNNAFIKDLYSHDWADNGKAAGSLFPNAAEHSTRAGETMHAFDAYAGEHYQDLLNMNGGKDSLGQINPELVRALGAASAPYIDDMTGKTVDDTSGYSKLDPGANANNLRGLFAVIDSDDQAGAAFNGAAANTWKEYYADYSLGIKNGDYPDGDLLQAAGKLQGAMDMGEYIHQLDSGKDDYAAKHATWEKRGEWYDAAHKYASLIPKVDDAVAAYDKIPGDPLRKLFMGEEPSPGTLTPMVLHNVDEPVRAVAEYLVAQKAGDLGILAQYVGPDGNLLPNAPNGLLAAYVSKAANYNDLPWINWTHAYEQAIYVSDGEFDKIKPPEPKK